MAEKQKKLKVFFSWQSDLPKKSNTNAIRSGLRKAKKSISTPIELDEATRAMSGSENIAQKILEKIQASDIFIADITTIRKAYRRRRAVPNPNVVFEVGFAVAHLGWSRVILLFNENHGNVPQDVPFDFSVNRVSTFMMSETPTKSEREKLEGLISSALAQVVASNPARPRDLEGLSESEIRHKRDVENLNWLLGALHIPTLQDHVESGPDYFTFKLDMFWEDFRAIVRNHLFHLNDATTVNIVERLYEAWELSLSYGQYYTPTSNPELYKFRHRYNPVSESIASKAAFNSIRTALSDMSSALEDLLSRVRSEYVEIDIDQANEKAWKGYLEFKKSMDA